MHIAVNRERGKMKMKVKRLADISSGGYHVKGIHDSYGWLCTDNEVNHPP